MFNLFRRRRTTAQPTAAAAPGNAPPSPPDDASAWQTWDGAAPEATKTRTQAETASRADGAPDADARQPPSGAPPGAAPPTPPDPPVGSPSSGPPPRGLALDEIARGMQHAAAAANQLLAQQYTRVLDTFFDSDEAGLLTARSVDVELDAEHTMPVPLVALATPRGLALEKMVVHLTVRGDFAEATPIEGGDHRARFHVTLAPPSKRGGELGSHGRDTEHIDIEMHFAALDPPDAIMRVVDEYTHRLVPRPKRDSHTDEEQTHA